MAVGRFYQYSPNDYKSVFAPFPTKELGDAIAAKTDMAMKSYDYGDALPAMINDKVKAYSKQDIETKNNTITDYSNRVAAIFQKNANDPAMSIFELRALSTDINRNLATGKLSNINKNAPQFETYFKDYEQKKNDYGKIIGSDPNVLITENSKALDHDSNANGAYTPYTPQLLTNPYSPIDLGINIVKQVHARVSEGNPQTVYGKNGDILYKIVKTTQNRLFAEVNGKIKDVTADYVYNTMMGYAEVQRSIKVLGVKPNEYLAPAVNAAMGLVYTDTEAKWLSGTNTFDAMIKMKNASDVPDEGNGYIEFLNKGEDYANPKRISTLLGGNGINPSYFSTDSWDANGNAIQSEPFKNVPDGIKDLVKQVVENNVRPIKSMLDLVGIDIKTFDQYVKAFTDSKSSIKDAKILNTRLEEIYNNSALIQHRLGGKYNGKAVYEFVNAAVSTTKNPYNIEYTISNMDPKDLNYQVLGVDESGVVPLTSLQGKTLIPLSGENMYNAEVMADVATLEGYTTSVMPSITYKDIDGKVKKKQSVPVIGINGKGKYALIDTKLNYLGTSEKISNFEDAKENIGHASMDKSSNLGYVSYIGVDANNQPNVYMGELRANNINNIKTPLETNDFTSYKTTGEKIKIKNVTYEIGTIIKNIDGEDKQFTIAAPSNGVKFQPNNVYIFDDVDRSIMEEMDKVTSNIKRKK